MLSSIGIALASRHIWLQNLPKDQVPECGPDLYYMLDTLPLFDALKKTLSGSGSCADISWTFANLTIPEQTLNFVCIFIDFVCNSDITSTKICLIRASN